MLYPLIVFSSNAMSFVSWIIQWRTRGSYNHAMFSTKKGTFTTQGLIYKQISDKKYKKQGCRLKYFKIKGLKDWERLSLFGSIRKKVEQPWYRNLYDFIGIFGQATGLNFLNNPMKEYCSEDVIMHLKRMAKVMIDSELKKIILIIPDQTSPAKLNFYLKKYPQYFECVDRWDSDKNL